MNKIDQALDSMDAAELAALEVEIDKQATDAKAAFHFQSGVKLAQEAVELFKKTGELSPLFSLLAPVKEAAAPGSLDAELDKCSVEQLSALEAELDKEAEAKVSEEYAAHYFNMGVKMAQDHVAKLSGGDATKVASCSKDILAKLAAGQFLGGAGFAAAKGAVSSARQAAGGSAVRAAKNIRAGAVPAIGGGSPVGNFAKAHPMAAGAAIGAGGALVANKMLGDNK